MSNLKPIKLLPARERVASALRKAILSQDLKEGSELSLDSAAAMLGVSITPIREAFQILASEGLLQLRPNKGAIILGVTEKTIKDHYMTRAVLEKEAVMATCRNNANLEEIIEAYNQGVEALESQNYHEYSNYNQAFHFAIWEAANNDKIKTLLSSMWNGLSMGHKVSEEDYAKISTTEHKAILQALIDRNEELAGQLMNNHILRSMENILTNLNIT